MLKKNGTSACTNPDENLVEEVLQYYAEKEKLEVRKRTIAEIEVADEEHGLQTSARKISSSENISIEKALANAQTVATNVAMTRCFIINSWSFNAVESDAFKKMVTEFRKITSSSYSIPNR